jgi:hypothetical protein
VEQPFAEIRQENKKVVADVKQLFWEELEGFLKFILDIQRNFQLIWYLHLWNKQCYCGIEGIIYLTKSDEEFFCKPTGSIKRMVLKSQKSP